MPTLGLGLGLSRQQKAVDVGGALSEITQVVCVADVGGSLHNRYFLVSDAFGRVSVTMDGGGLIQIIHVELPSALGLITVAEGKFVAIDGGAGLEYYWFNTGSETEPSAGAAVYHEIAVGVSDSASDVMLALLASVVSNGLIDSGSSGSTLVVACSSEGLREAPIPDSPITAGIDQAGRDAAVDPGVADRNLMVSYPEDSSAEAVTTALVDALNSDGAWAAAYLGDTEVTLTDATTGERLDAADHDTGFAITTPQQGN